MEHMSIGFTDGSITATSADLVSRCGALGVGTWKFPAGCRKERKSELIPALRFTIIGASESPTLYHRIKAVCLSDLGQTAFSNAQ